MQRPVALLRALPLSRISGPLGNVGGSILDTSSHIGNAIAQRPTDTARGAIQCLANTSARGADNATDCVGNARNGVADSRGDELGAAGDAGVVVLVETRHRDEVYGLFEG